jgi:protein-tyrosine phosphatase
MIDIHSHILSGLDDGSPMLDESIKMAKLAVQDGISTIIATPHYGNGRYEVSRERVVNSVERLNKELLTRDIPLTVLPGHEVRVTRDMLDKWQDGKLLTLGETDYILLELPSNEVPTYTAEYIHELGIQGITAIIAHPERNAEIISNPSALAELIEAGALTQLTTHSINGDLGKKIAKVSLELCEKQMVHLIANDAHNSTSRAFAMKRAYEVLADRFGRSYIEYLQHNAQLLINNEEIATTTVVKPKRKWFQFR